MARTQQSVLLASQRMRIAYLLAAVGGYMDAYTYFMRGGVFANAQTGNIVKLAIALADGKRDAYLGYLLPIVAFSIGLITARAIDSILERRGIRFVRRMVLLVEAAALVVVGLIPIGEEWNTLANCIVSFVASLQYESFTTFRGDAIVTTMSTGNLRKMVDALYVGATEKNRGELARAGRYFSIILTFAFGAYVGAWCCDVMVKTAVLPAVAALLLAILIITMLRRHILK